MPSRRALLAPILTLSFLAVSVTPQAWGQSVDSLNFTLNSPATSFAVQTDGHIVLGGQFTTFGGQTRNYLARLNPDGTLDSTFNPNANGAVYSVAIQPDGKIVVGGSFTMILGQPRNHLARLSADGTGLDPFDPGVSSISSTPISAMQLQPDGKILVGGIFSSLGGQSCNDFGRLNADGSLDTDFNPAVDGGGIYSIALQTNGAIVLTGYFTSIGGQGISHIGRVFADGSVDSSFNPWSAGSFFCAAVQADGGILLGGTFTTLAGQTCNNLGRLFPDGSLDTAFNPSPNNYLQTLVLQADGAILIGGNFTTAGGANRNRIARLLPSGTADPTFNPSANNTVSCLGLQPDGDVLASGLFTSLGGQSRTFLGRVISTSSPTQLLSRSGAQVTWQRGATSPEVFRVTFESSANGTTWNQPLDASRIAGGWQASVPGLTGSQWLRARGYTTAGTRNGSCWFSETMLLPDVQPQILALSSSTFTGGPFGFSFVGPSGRNAIIEASFDLLHWVPLRTNTLIGDPQNFTDTSPATNHGRFYRLHVP